MGVRDQVAGVNGLWDEVGNGFCDPIRELDLADKGVRAVATGRPKRPPNQPADMLGEHFVGIDWVQRVTIDQAGVDKP